MIEYTISRQMEMSAETFKNKLALSFPAENVKMDFVTLKKNADQVSKALLGAGLKKVIILVFGVLIPHAGFFLHWGRHRLELSLFR